jgi:hypothetical protein
VQQQDLDRQGRMVIPPKLREYAALDQDVLLVGVINRIEIWSPARWAEKNNLAAGGATPRRRGAARQSAEGRQAGGSRRSGATRPAGSARSTGSPGSPGSTGSPGSGQSAGTTRESDAGTQVRGGGQGRPAPRTRTGDPPEGDREG